MTIIARTSRPAALLGLALLALAPSQGCVSSAARKAEEVAAQKKAKSHFEIGADHLRKGRTALALRELMAAEQLAPDRPRIQYALGEAYMVKGRYDDAEQHLKRALELQPEFHDARLHLAVLYLEVERYRESIVESQRLIDDPTFPGVWRALTNAGWAEFKLGDGAAARRRLELALEFNPNYWPALLNLGILESQEGHRPEAIAVFHRLLSLQPGASATAEANYRLAEIYVSLGNRKQAVGHLVAAVEETPNGRWGQKSEEYLRLLR